MVQVGKVQLVAVDRSLTAAAGTGPGGVVEGMEPAVGEDTVEGRVANMGLVICMAAHSTDRLVVHSHRLDLAEALIHNLGRASQVDDDHIGCMLEVSEAPDNRTGDNYSAGQIAAVSANHTGLGGIAEEAFH